MNAELKSQSRSSLLASVDHDSLALFEAWYRLYVGRYKYITAMLNPHSPTTLLHSIHSMRTKLHSDKQLLIEIRQDFNHIRKPKPPHDKENQPPTEEQLVEPPPKTKIAELKREHQREMQRLKEEHAREITELKQEMELRIHSVDQVWRRKFEQQADYIAVLEEQTTSPIQTERQKGSHEQYDQVITQLLQLNSSLHQQLHLARPTHHHRLLPTKLTSTPSPSQPLHKRVSSIYLFNDQNVDRSNLVHRSKLQLSCEQQWEDESIGESQGGLGTIREWGKGSAGWQ